MSADAKDRMKCDACAYDMFSTIWHCSMMDNISGIVVNTTGQLVIFKMPVRAELEWKRGSA